MGQSPVVKPRACCICYRPASERPLRPYGPRGADICFPCMKESPEREREARYQFARCMGLPPDESRAAADSPDESPDTRGLN